VTPHLHCHTTLTIVTKHTVTPPLLSSHHTYHRSKLRAGIVDIWRQVVVETSKQSVEREMYADTFLRTTHVKHTAVGRVPGNCIT